MPTLILCVKGKQTRVIHMDIYSVLADLPCGPGVFPVPELLIR